MWFQWNNAIFWTYIITQWNPVLTSFMVTSSNGNIFRVTGEFPTQRPVTQSFDVFFDLHLNKRLSKQSRGWSFETPYDVIVMFMDWMFNMKQMTGISTKQLINGDEKHYDADKIYRSAWKNTCLSWIPSIVCNFIGCFCIARYFMDIHANSYNAKGL